MFHVGFASTLSPTPRRHAQHELALRVIDSSGLHPSTEPPPATAVASDRTFRTFVRSVFVRPDISNGQQDNPPLGGCPCPVSRFFWSYLPSTPQSMPVRQARDEHQTSLKPLTGSAALSARFTSLRWTCRIAMRSSWWPCSLTGGIPAKGCTTLTSLLIDSMGLH